MRSPKPSMLCTFPKWWLMALLIRFLVIPPNIHFGTPYPCLAIIYNRWYTVYQLIYSRIYRIADIEYMIYSISSNVQRIYMEKKQRTRPHASSVLIPTYLRRIGENFTKSVLGVLERYFCYAALNFFVDFILFFHLLKSHLTSVKY